MQTPFTVLCLETLIFWIIVVALHQKRNKITIIPLYSYIAVLTVLMHNFTDLSFAIVIDQWFFLISSFALFTTLMFGVLFLYLFEGPRAGRLALWVILFSSLFYIGTVYFLDFQVDTTKWVQFSAEQAMYYFWSLFAIVLDVFFLAVFWELLSKIKFLNLTTRVFLVIFGVFALDSVVFTTGAFWNMPFYPAILKGNLTIRFFLSLIGAPIMAHFLKEEGFEEEKRAKPKKIWEIMNFRSDLEVKITALETVIENQEALEEKLRTAKEKYELAISGVGAGLWDWEIAQDKLTWSPKFLKFLGYDNDDLGEDFEALKKIIYPADSERVSAAVAQCMKDGSPFEIECRLKTKSGQYRWFIISGNVKFEQDKPSRMIGSIIDINSKKEDEMKLREKIAELAKLNEMMLGRELKMIELKKQLDELKK